MSVLSIGRRAPARAAAAAGLGGLRVAPTGSGAVVLALAIGLVLAAINYSNNLMFLLAFLLLAAGVASLAPPWLALRRLREAGWLPCACYANLGGTLSLRVQGAAARLPALSLELRIGGQRRPLHGTPDEGGRAAALLRLALPPRPRGRLPLAQARLATIQPLGLWRVSVVLRQLPDVVVYPAPAGDAPLPLDDRRARARLSAADDEFNGLRDYQDGDPPSRIDWRALARLADDATPPVRAFDGAAGGAVLHLDWYDVRGGTEARVSQLAAWVIAADERRHRYSLALPGSTVPPGSGAAQRHRCLTALALHEAPV